MVCVDDRAADLVESLNLPRLVVVRHDEYVTEELRRTRAQRSLSEYCWSSKPFAMLHVMGRFPDATWVVYLDSDMMVFADPDIALPGDGCHYLLTPHRFHASFARYAKEAGVHNAGYVAARNTVEGQKVLSWWGNRCIERCSAVPTERAYADQKYLDEFGVLFPFGESSMRKGLNVAPWNIDSYQVHCVGDRISVDDEPLLLYHFQSLQTYDDGTLSLYRGRNRIAVNVMEAIYSPYVNRLVEAYRRLRQDDPSYRGGLVKKQTLLGWHFLSRVAARLRSRTNLVHFPVKGV